jgi:mevalonate kinase
MSKQKHDPTKALVKAFNNEVNDTELQENYDRLVRDLARLKEEHNKIIPQANENLEKIRSLKDAIFNQAINGIIATEAIEKIKEIEADNEKYLSNINIYLEKINKTATLIEKYEDWSTRKLFIWWQAIKAVDPETVAWLEWKKTYEGKII